jgi:protein TonB
MSLADDRLGPMPGVEGWRSDPRPRVSRSGAELPDPLALLGISDSPRGRRALSTRLARRRSDQVRMTGLAADAFPQPLRAQGRGGSVRFAVGLAAGLAFHAVVAGALWTKARALPTRGPSGVENPRTMELIVETAPPVVVEEPEAPPPSLPPPPAAVDEAPAAVPKSIGDERREAPPSPSTSAAPGQAGAALVQADDAPAAEEMLDFTLVTGDAPAYVGRATAADGTGTIARDREQVARGGRGSGGTSGSARDRSQPARLPARNWDCDWPRQADTLGIDEQAVLLRVDLDARGRATGVQVLDDPGNGFGAAALACARSARYEPARDRSGAPTASSLGPIRVRFTR